MHDLYAVWQRLMMTHPVCHNLMRELRASTPTDPRRGAK